MKKIVSFILMLGLLGSFSAYGEAEITMREIYDAGRTEAMLENHQSAYVRRELNGELYSESYLTEDYIYDYDRSFGVEEFLTDDAYYCCYDSAYARIVPISPDGIIDIASYRAEYYSSLLFEGMTLDETIESVAREDGRITVASFFDQEVLGDTEEEGLISGNFEYVLDAETLELISGEEDYGYDGGTVDHMVWEALYDTDAPEKVKEFLEYDQQTEDLRTITVVTNPGTGKETSRILQIPKGMLVGFSVQSGDEEKYELYADAACTEPYTLYEDTVSDTTIYIQWNK
ncbi:MAG: hypothetical protein U0L09_05645 [Christensenellales bacterium]|nr:hypothetical protein [Christensenellales bacterium]